MTNKAKPIELTQELLNELLTYDPETGKLYWKRRNPGAYISEKSANIFNGNLAGKEAFTSVTHCGYKNGRVFNVTYRAHRVIWLMTHGEWPKYDVDHINGDRCDNRISNLRSVDRSINTMNACIRKDNKSGKVGVWKNYRSWYAAITINKEVIRLGRFDTFEEASKARDDAERKYGFHENHGRKKMQQQRPKSQMKVQL